MKKIWITFFIILISLLIFFVIPSSIVFFQNDDTIIEFVRNGGILKYNLLSLVQNLTEDIEILPEEQEQYYIEEEGKTSYKFEVNIKNLDKLSKYQIIYYNNQQTEFINVNSNKTEFYVPIGKEGKNEIIIEVKQNDNTIKTKNFNIYCIRPYKKQFLDEYNINSISNKMIDINEEEIKKQIKLMKTLGINNVRAGIWMTYLDKINSNNYDFTLYDKWIKSYNEYNIGVSAILGGDTNHFGSDRKVSSQEEVNKFVKYFKQIEEHYPTVKDYQIMNEPNSKYVTKEDIFWYTNIVKAIEKIKKGKNNIIVGETTTPEKSTEKRITSQEFLQEIFNNNKQISNISYHLYDFSYNGLNKWFNDIIKSHNSLLNENGGFIKANITEYGSSTYKNSLSEQEQANKLIQQNTIQKENNIQYASLYCFKNISDKYEDKESNFGLIKNNNIPKKSYYALKNYYENTNGAEYIGTLNIAEGLEAHVYDKDGKPKIVAWSYNTSKDIPISYEGFTAKDLYGNEIENTDGTLTITTSPVYLDNVEEKYFYQAISNTAIEKYAELEEKFAEQLQKVPEINQQIQSLKGQIEQIGKVENKIEEETAKTLMQRHFQLGNSLINAFQNGRLEIEKVKLSSMLDMLNDIGNSYEDLVTVTATTRNADINQAKDLVNEVENIIQSNSDIEIIYPEKILDFSKDFQEKAEYINGLEEENDIKTGLIVSKNLHSIYLSDWAKEFTNIYIDEYLKNNLIPETYSEKDITNQDVTVTLNIGNDTKIINNNGSNQYTFKENGEFTFEYERRGRNFRQTIKVDNIDKQSPNITGVKQGQVYENTVKPIVEDDNLETIRLIQDGRLIENYINKTELTEEGVYRIEAEDKAGNKTIVNFEIIENISKDYIIKEEQIENIQVNTTVEEFRKKLQIESYYTIIRQEQTLNEKSIIQTGDILQLENGTQYPLIVRGDIDKDGNATIRDLLLLKQHINEESTLEDIQKIAGDIDLNGKLDARDVVKLRKLILTNNAP